MVILLRFQLTISHLIVSLALMVAVAGCASPTIVNSLANLESLQRKLDKATIGNKSKASIFDEQLTKAIASEYDLGILQSFTEKFPTAKHAEQAKARIKAVLAMKADVDEMLSLPDLHYLQRKLDKATVGNKSETLALSEQLTRAIASESDLRVLQSFTEKFPTATHVEQVNARIKALLDEKTNVDANFFLSTKYPQCNLSLKVKQRVMTIIATNTSCEMLGEAYNRVSDVDVKLAIENRLGELITKSTNVCDLARLSISSSGTSHGQAAKSRAEQLIEDWKNERSNSRVVDLLVTMSDSVIRNSEIATVASKALEQFLKSNYETITEEEYKRNFIAPNGSLLCELVAWIRRYACSPDSSLGHEMYQNNGLSIICSFPETGFAIMKKNITFLPPKDGVIEFSLHAEGLDYSRSEYNGKRIILETVTRRASTSGATVATEVIRMGGVIYRKSEILSL